MKRRLQNQNQNKNSQSAAAEAVASIDDLLLEIFARLRLKALVRFKSVSKRWNSLASDPRLHRLRNQLPVGLITPANFMGNNDDHLAYVVPFDCKSDRPTFVEEFPKSSDAYRRYWWTNMLQSCNGLLICVGFMDSNWGMGYFVLNPTTMKCSMLPAPRTARALDMCLAFDPSTSPYYKVVCVTDDRDYPFQVYSSQTRSWRVIRGTHEELSVHKLQIWQGAYWNGAIHWISNDPNFDSFCFNPDQVNDREVLRVFPSPPRCVDGYNYYFGESGGHLHYLHNNVGKGEVTVYEMRTDYSEWFVKHKFRVDVRSRKLVFIHYFFRAEKEEDCFVVLGDGNRLLRQNILSGTSETMVTRVVSTHMLPYFESICLV